MKRDWQDGDRAEQEAVAARSLADGWHAHYLARQTELGGGLTISQLRTLQARLEGVELPGPKPIDWDQWLAWADSDPTAAAHASRFLRTVGDCVVAEGRVRWSGHAWRSPQRISPREILRAAAANESIEWEIERSAVQRKLVEGVAPRPTDQLVDCLAASWPRALEQARHCLVSQAHDQLVGWVCRFASRALCETGVSEPVVAAAHDRRQLAVVAVDADGVCCGERVVSLDQSSLLQQAIPELARAVGAPSVIGRADTLMAMKSALVGISADLPEAGWLSVDGCGAHWWAKQLDAVTTFGQWSALGREALFMARTFQSPLETLAEVPAAEFAPMELHQWLDAADWEQVEQHVDDVIHERGLDVYRSGPRAVARLCSVSPLHAHRGRPPTGGWRSLEQFRDALRLNDQQWTQTAPFVRLGVCVNAPPPNALRIRRNRILAWDQLEEGQRCHGLVLRAATFGAFLDIGAPCEAMLHISECSRRFVSDPWECLAPGEIVEVEISQLDLEKQRIALRMVDGAKDGAKSASRTKSASSRARESQRSARESKRRSQSRARSGGKRKPKNFQHQSTAKPPPQPLSQEMANGKAPMRSFSDLVQFYDQKRTEEDSSS